MLSNFIKKLSGNLPQQLMHKAKARLGLAQAEPNAETLGLGTGKTLVKWLGLGLVIGIVAGLGAICFTFAIDFCTHLFLGTFAGYAPPSAAGEGSAKISKAELPWLFPFLLAAGGLVSGLIVYFTAPEAAGHGTDAAIAAFHHRGGRVRRRVPFIKLITSAITIGTGGSGGREGPTAQISAGFGSVLATWLKLTTTDRRIAMVTGMGAGIGAIFKAPLGGAVMAAEILYLHDIEVEVLIPTLVASIVGYTVYSSAYGWTPVFGAELNNLTFNNPVQLFYYAGLGLICGLVGLFYAWCFHNSETFFRKNLKRLPTWAKPALGGFLAGLLALISPGFIHMGYGWVQTTLSTSSTAGLLSLPLWLVILLPFGKILATSFSIGSGGSGGIFGPGMVIGGFVGAACWRLTEGWLPGIPENPAPFVIVAMMALFGGIAHAPLAVMLMVGEMTGNLSLLAPAMVAVAVSLLVCGNRTIYTNQLENRAYSPVHRYRFSFPLLASLPVTTALQAPAKLLQVGMPLTQALEILESSESDLPIVGNAQRLTGVMAQSQIATFRQTLNSPELSLKLKEADPTRTVPPLCIAGNKTLLEALEIMAEQGVTWLPVVQDEVNYKLLGSLAIADIIQTYQKHMNQQIHSLEATVKSLHLLEIRLPNDSVVTGLKISELQLPAESLIVSIHRQGELLVPRGSLVLEAGDLLTILAEPAKHFPLRAYLQAKTTIEI